MRCKLCELECQLQNSHIIPHFVFNWLRETSPSYIRSTLNPNRRIQDGAKKYLLCKNCEEYFSGYEKKFAENLFTPLHATHGKAIPIKYSDWCIRFAVSVSWRVLHFFSERGLDHLSEIQKLADPSQSDRSVSFKMTANLK